MSWERRCGGGRYYTRKRTVGGKVVREYVGTGLAGQLAAFADQQQRQAREARLAADLARRARLDQVTAQVQALETVSRDLLVVTLYAAGLYRHRRQWRYRGNTEDS